MLTGHEQTCTEGGINVTGKNPRCQNLFPYFAVTRHKTGTYYPFEINQMEIIMFKLTTPPVFSFSTCPPPHWRPSAMKSLALSMISTCLPPSGTKREPCSGISTTMTHSPKTRCWQWHWLTLNTSPRLMMAGISCSASSAITVSIYLVFPDTTVITQLQNLIEALTHE